MGGRGAGAERAWGGTGLDWRGAVRCDAMRCGAMRRRVWWRYVHTCRSGLVWIWTMRCMSLRRARYVRPASFRTRLAISQHQSSASVCGADFHAHTQASMYALLSPPLTSPSPSGKSSPPLGLRPYITLPPWPPSSPRLPHPLAYSANPIPTNQPRAAL